MTGIIWDWNGTLLDDTEACLDALNGMLAARGQPPISLAYYRDNFSFPVRPFYELVGIDLSHEDWDELAREYHDRYAALPKQLNAETMAALDTLKFMGYEQYIVSAMREDLLLQQVRDFGIEPFMARVCGSNNLNGASKMVRAHELVNDLWSRCDDVNLVAIGDAIHDFEVAKSLHIPCVLCAQGGHSYERLARVAPTAKTLSQAVRLAIEL